uniref:RNA-directed DNA polymerase n=1 Tax=Drosophila melanogaster TaxID=7227 RepID=Q8T4B4_DROME|nr:AT07338p [Drosophila melanogaster]
MGVGAATVRFRNLVQKGPAEHRCRRTFKTTSAGDEPKNELEVHEQPREQQGCRCFEEMRRKVKQPPQKFPDYLEEDGKLYRHIAHRACNEEVASWKMCIPIGQRQRVMTENHDMPTAARYYWPGMHRGVRKYVRNCECCMMYKPSQLQAAGKMLTQVPEEPWATVCADFVGPLPRSKHGNSMLLVLVDRFSKWTEIVPMRRATTETMRKAVRERIVARYGVPKVMITDNNVQLTIRAFRKFLEELGVRHQLTAPYTPQENPTERANRTVKTMIAQFTGADQRTWDEHWPELQLAVNTSVAETTGYSPAFITQGREPRLPNALFDEKTTGTGKCTQTPVENAEKLKEIFELVRRNMEKAVQDQARHYNLRRRPWKPKVRDTVWAKEHHLSKAAEGFAAKLAPRFDGPYMIKKFTSPVICVLEHKTSKKEKTAHISDLKPGSAGAGGPGDFEE